MNVFAQMYVCKHMLTAHGRQRMALGTLELELQMVGSHPVDAEN